MVLYQNRLLSTWHATFFIPVEDISPKCPLAISRQNNISASWYLIQNSPHPCNFQAKYYPTISVCSIRQNKVEPGDKSTLPLILLYTRKAKSFTFETIIATLFTFLFLEPDASFLLK